MRWLSARRPAGPQVTLIAANVSLPDPPGARVVAVGTAAELGAAAQAAFADCDVLVMAAAVADFRPARAAAHKLKKDQGVPTLELEPTVDVLAALARPRRPQQLLVGFAAEHGEGALDYARDKLARKRLDAIVVNDISQPGIGFDSEANEVTILSARGASGTIARTSKARIADAILDELEAMREGAGESRWSPSRQSRPRLDTEPFAALARRLAANVAGAVQVAPRTLEHVHRRPAGRGPRARGGLPRRGQDRAGPGDRALDRLPVRPRAVHIGSPARRRGRHQCV